MTFQFIGTPTNINPTSSFPVDIPFISILPVMVSSNPLVYTPIPAFPDQPHQPQNCIVLPVFYHSAIHRRGRILSTTIPLVLIAIALYVLWPSDPDLTIVRLTIHRVRVHTHPRIAVDVSLSVSVRVRNPDFYSIDYRRLVVAIGYRGKELGHVTSSFGNVRARGSSYMDAIAEVDGVEVLSDWIYLLQDLAKGTVPFETATAVDGRLGLFFFELPLKAKLLCEVDVNTKNQTITHQNCYPE